MIESIESTESTDSTRGLPTVQVTFDCADPHRLAAFWSAATGMAVEHHGDVVRAALSAGYATPADAIEVDGELAWAGAAACSDPEGRLPRLLFQQVPEPKTSKNRVHLDLHVGADRRGALVERLLALGAVRLWDGRQGPHTWVTLADPEGNELCIA